MYLYIDTFINTIQNKKNIIKNEIPFFKKYYYTPILFTY